MLRVLQNDILNPDHFLLTLELVPGRESYGRCQEMAAECVPPRMCALDRSASWINFHLRRDHQGAPRFKDWCGTVNGKEMGESPE